MKITQEITTIFFSTPSEYNREKGILIDCGWIEKPKSTIFIDNGIYSTFYTSK
ncbi:hypothetical protein [Clostridium sp.]